MIIEFFRTPFEENGENVGIYTNLTAFKTAYPVIFRQESTAIFIPFIAQKFTGAQTLSTVNYALVYNDNNVIPNYAFFVENPVQTAINYYSAELTPDYWGTVINCQKWLGNSLTTVFAQWDILPVDRAATPVKRYILPPELPQAIYNTRTLITGNDFGLLLVFDVKNKYTVFCATNLTEYSPQAGSSPIAQAKYALKILQGATNAVYYENADDHDGDNVNINLRHIYILPKNWLYINDVGERFVFLDGLFGYPFYTQIAEETRYQQITVNRISNANVLTVGTRFTRVTLTNIENSIAITLNFDNNVNIIMTANGNNYDITSDFEISVILDVASQYLATQGVSTAIKGISAVGTLASGMATLNPVLIGAGALSAVNFSAGLIDKANQPPSLKAQGDGLSNIEYFNGFYAQEFAAANASAVNATLSKYGTAVELITNSIDFYQPISLTNDYFHAQKIQFSGAFSATALKEIENYFLRGVRIFYNQTL